MKQTIFKTLLILFFVCSPVFAQNAEQEISLTAEQQTRYQNLIHQTRCLVCQNQTIADSQAPLAQDLKQKIRERLTANQSDEEILQYLTARYGEFILYKPRFQKTTVILWLAPWLCLLLGGAILFSLYRRNKPGSL